MIRPLRNSIWFAVVGVALCVAAFCHVAVAQSGSAAAALGSSTARNGFRNEDEIRDKFNNWKTDAEASAWLASMGYAPETVRELTASKPHGEKADVEVAITTKTGTAKEGISIKLVSGPQGFNQIDKRWLSHYVEMWKMPVEVATALKLFVGETKPVGTTRSTDRMFLDEFDAAQRQKIVDFFTANRKQIISDLFEGDGPHAAKWIMVALKNGTERKWIIKRAEDVIKFFGDGPVVVTRGGNLRVGRITMQRKGGDAGRDTAKMLQFKINPAELFDAK